MSITITIDNRDVTTVADFFESLSEFNSVTNEIVPRQTFYVAETATGELVGALTVDPEGHIARVGVKREYRNRGIGEQLFERAENAETADTFELVCEPENNVGQEFFESLGFSGSEKHGLIHYTKQI